MFTGADPERAGGLTILELRATDVKRIRAVRIVPPATGLVEISGDNGAGKSSTLSVIVTAFGGKAAGPALPIRQGAKEARESVTLQDAEGTPILRVERHWTQQNSYLDVERIGHSKIVSLEAYLNEKLGPALGKVKSMQGFLDALVGAGLAYDPGAFPIYKVLEAAAKLGVKPPATPQVPPKPTTPAPLPIVSLAHVVAAAKRDPGKPEGGTTHKAEVLLVERSLVELGYLNKAWVDGSFGTKTRDAYRLLQRHLGYSGDAADGVPGSHSLTWLGLKTQNFRKGD